ncbi:glycosyltransferase, exosortase A system-associated [Dechloromonas sp. XY25]|uniref:Glycosyltransferase, exosortase A system-associated n=1 Tax=Dechloromonas hankyongensis TaxID=2908002 RepID=A0ABS9K3N3_9RHOO|nr:TIGR04063 family PEP-CTERM/XrtA system glycosyltransferase [Dechloromonas hankyongensis]MCG2577746.1 glycosyltransferase, exosortase A system-associated [Dechloromonas hankyongensis]
MRVLHVLDHSIPLHSGYAFRSLALLTEQRKLGWETLHLTTPKQGNTEMQEEEVDGWLFHRTQPTPEMSGVRGYFRQMSATRTSIERLIERYSPDIIHPHSPVLNAIPAITAGRKRGIPVVYEMRASWEDAAVDHGTTVEGSLRYRLSRALESWALRKADGITTICAGLREDILSRGGIPSEKVTVIPNAVNVESFAYAPAAEPELRLRLGLENCTVLGFAGSFYGYEGLDLLLDAAKQLLPRYPDLKVLLVGGGPQEKALKEQAQRLALGDRVVFTGRVPHADVQRYYGQIDLLCYPRKSMRLTDLVTPLKPLEAMAQGKLLIASDVGGHRELVRDGETGILFQAGNAVALASAIDRMLGNRDQWESIRRAGRRFVESERTWARSAENYRTVYSRVLSPARLATLDLVIQD